MSKIYKHFNLLLNKSTDESLKYNFYLVGLLGGVGHPLYWLIWTYIFPQQHDDLWLRSISGLLCLSLLYLKHFTPCKQKWLPLYWHLCLIFVLPFIFTTLLLINNFALVYITSLTLIISFVLILIYNIWLSNLCLLTGILVGTGYFVVFYNTQLDYIELLITLPLFSFAVAIGSLLSYVDNKRIISYARAKERSIVMNKAWQVTKQKSYSIAHEMRNSIGSLVYGIEAVEKLLLQSEKHTPNQHGSIELDVEDVKSAQEAIKLAYTSYKQGEVIIDMLLSSISHEEIDKDTFVCKPAVEIIRSALKSFPYRNAIERNAVNFNLPQKEFLVFVESTFLIFVIYNLLKNALYYVRDYSDAKIYISCDEDNRRIICRDTGPGIKAEKISTVLQDYTTSGKKGGTGLGLAFCRRTMRSFDGNIEVKSEYGAWTEFSLSFPPLTAEQKNKTISTIQYNKQIEEKTSYKNINILVVDDQEMIVMVARSCLSSLECKVDVAVDGIDAIEQLKHKHYDLVLMDIQMPKMDGLVCTRIIREGKVFKPSECTNHKTIPIIAHTSKHLEIKDKVLKVGMNDFLQKPAGKKALTKMVIKWLTPLAEKKEEQTLVPKKILLVEDDMFNTLAVTKQLHNIGCSVTAATNGKEAIKLLEGEEYDLVLLDLDMPIMNGKRCIELIRYGRYFKRFTNYATIPVIFLSGDKVWPLKKCLSYGVNGMLTKPLTEDALIAGLKKHF